MKPDYNIHGKKVRLITPSYGLAVGTEGIAIYEPVYKHGISINLARLNGNGYYDYFFFWNEVELVEESKNNSMNTLNLKVGDVIDTGSSNFIDCDKEDVVTSIIEGINEIWLSKSGRWVLDNTIRRIETGQWKLVKQDTMKEIIGYKLKNSKYEKAAIEIVADAGQWKNLSFVDFMLTAGNKGYATMLREAGVLDLWFDVIYESSEVTVKLSKNRTATIISKSIAVISISDDKMQVTNTEIDALADIYNKASKLTIAGYKVGLPRDFSLGCQTFTMDDVLGVNNAFTNFK